MDIGIIGSGNVGKTLAQRWLAKNHRIIFGSRNPSSSKMAELLETLGSLASSSSLQELEAQAEVLVLAVPWEAALTSVQAIGDFKNKVLIDATNPITMTPEGLQTGLLVGQHTSA
ncbi:MAG TPA: NAD(P)-binding domain-containing protein, partial [Candidatus Sericytochromatia bacterium]